MFYSLLQALASLGIYERPLFFYFSSRGRYLGVLQYIYIDIAETTGSFVMITECIFLLSNTEK